MMFPVKTPRESCEFLARHAFGQELHALEVDLLDLVSSRWNACAVRCRQVKRCVRSPERGWLASAFSARFASKPLL
jgi:hypothetical protein